MKNGWTGGQYSLARIALGLCLVTAALHVTETGDTWWTVGGWIMVVAAALIIIGWMDRVAAGVAFVISLVLCSIASVNHLDALWSPDGVVNLNPPRLWMTIFGATLPGLFCIIHVFQKPAPYLSLAARGRPDPAGGWTYRRWLFVMAWAIMAIGYTTLGFVLLVTDRTWRDGEALQQWLINDGYRIQIPEVMTFCTWWVLGSLLSFAFLAPIKRARPLIWLNVLVINLLMGFFFNTYGLTAALLAFHALTFCPSWIKAKPARSLVDKSRKREAWEEDEQDIITEMVFYDGNCGLCHRSVRFVLSEDPSGKTFTFSPLQGETFERTVPAAKRAELPDSIIVRTHDGELLVRSDAIAHLLQRLGGIWRPLGVILSALPRFIRDGGYKFIASIRHMIFAKPKDACPLMPKELRGRFQF